MLYTGLCLIPALGGHHLSVISQSTAVVIAPPAIVLLVHVRVFFFAFTRMSSCVCEPTLTSSSRTPAKEKKTFVGEINNLAGVPDHRCNSGARTRMACVIVPSWPLPRTSYQVNITVNKQITVSKQWLSRHRVVSVATRRRVRQCHAAAAALL